MVPRNLHDGAKVVVFREGCVDLRIGEGSR